MHDRFLSVLRRISDDETVCRQLEAHRSQRGAGRIARGVAWALLVLVAVLAAGPVTAAPEGCPEAAETEVYQDAANSFTIAFPSDFTVTTDPNALAPMRYFPLDDGEMRLGGCYSGQEFEGTNFGSACIVVGSRPAETREADCARFDGDLLCGTEQGVRDVVVNGLRFKSATLSDAAVGHRLEMREYWTVHRGRRYEIRLSVSYTDIGMYSPGEKREFSQEACWAKLTDILNSFSFR